MKKKLSVIAVIILVLAICVSAWFYGYYNHKSNDNLPTLAAIAEMSEADVNSLLPGYHNDRNKNQPKNIKPFHIIYHHNLRFSQFSKLEFSN